ncbi:hypothetical protein AMTR_s00030p00239270 [Amborella trichopoda]|uniref:H(+)-transporting two-sector ATPase n=1 Tax=Amborella trichopoda TaxID=13333 RepID=U5D758_AMBTC|nr:hypothetical protein AMTR_s00030p00239270 [Amborella trichopoda]
MVAMSATYGLMRGMEVIDARAPLSVPVGEATLRRIFNVLGEPVDNLGIKVVDLLASYRRGEKIGLFGGAEVGKTIRIMELINNIAKAHRGSEVSALISRMPSAMGYQPTLSTEMGPLQETITSTKEGSITSIQAIYVPTDDLTDHAPATTFSHLDATTILSRGLVAEGIYPAVDPLDSTLTMLQPRIVGEEHYETTQRVKQTLQHYKEL